ncbi:MAG TPA: hypothetical protein PKH10_09360 [bacterium]|nr:hypothetical protein [bacterium]
MRTTATLLTALAVMVMAALIYSCSTEDPVSGGCITAFDCEDGYSCIGGECVNNGGGGDTDKVDDADLPVGDDGEAPDETPDETTEEEGPEEDGLTVDDDQPVGEGDETPDMVTDADVDDAALCSGVTCGGHGTCKVEGGVAVCQCYEGYQDKDGDNVCLVNCANSGLNCGTATHDKCDDSSGMPKCVCDPVADYQDNDENGTCLPTCAKAGLTCTGGTCDDSTGTAKCTCTDTNYQDNDNNGTCEPTCAFANPSCALHSHCDDAGGTATCVCDDGYITPPACTTCDTNFHSDGSGNCLPNQGCQPNNADCNGHGTCSDSGGVPVCSCFTGYTGTYCTTCATGYQDQSVPGTCLPDCNASCAQNPLLVCPDSHGHCDYSGGSAVCVCDQGWENPSIILPVNGTFCFGEQASPAPECSDCKISDPPPEYLATGCPADCDSNPVITCTGDCYYHTDGEKYCKP